MARKLALIIGNTEYMDPGLMQLTAPGNDAADLARVLKEPSICAFDEVRTLLNELSSTVTEAIDEFFDEKKPDDLLVLYFSGHGLRDEFGSLYLAFKNTIRTRLRATAVKSDYIREAMDQSRSKRQVLILDCCNSGAFPQGSKAAVGGPMGMASAFEGYGRFVLMASDATQFAWEGDKVIGSATDNSLFTHFLVRGLEGEADRDADGSISVDDLYDYAYDEISRITAKQTPTKAAYKVEGDIILRRIRRLEDIKPVPLPADLRDEVEDTRPYVREAAVRKLEKILHGTNLGMVRSALDALQKIAADENTTRRVADEAARIMEAYHRLERERAAAEASPSAAPALDAAPLPSGSREPSVVQPALSSAPLDDARPEAVPPEDLPRPGDRTIFSRHVVPPIKILPSQAGAERMVAPGPVPAQPAVEPVAHPPREAQRLAPAPAAPLWRSKQRIWIGVVGAVLVGCCACGLAARWLFPSGLVPVALPTDTASIPVFIATTGLSTLAPTLVPADTAAPGETLVSFSPTPAAPSIEFVVNANCREGPGTLYEILGSFLAGDTVQIIGRNEGDPRWWLVAAPNLPHGKCWVSAVTGTTSGPVDDVPFASAPPPPTFTPRPTRTPAPPTPPPTVTAFPTP